MVYRNTRVLVILFVILSIAGCDKIKELKQPGANDILNNYLDAKLKGRSEEAYGYISTEDKAVKSLGEYKSDNDIKDNPLAALMVSNVKFKVTKLTESGSTANANVEVTLPDMSVMLKDMMAAALNSAFGGKDKAEIEKLLAKKYETAAIPTTTENKEFHLIKEKDGWKVFLNLKAIKSEKERNDKISALMAEAEKLKKSKKLPSAIKKYEEVLALNGEMVEAKEAINESNKEISIIKEKQAYLDKVVLYGLRAKYYETYLEKKAPGVEFKIKNNGNRTLKEVQVTVYFKDSKGTVIFEKKYYPVHVSEYSFSDNNKPLKPNYIWQMERGKFYTADSVPSEWKEGAVSAQITNIDFSN